MGVGKWNMELIGSLKMQENDTDTPQGGGPNVAVGMSMRDLDSGSDSMKCISDSASDTTQTITVYGRLLSSAKASEGKTLNGTTPVAYTTTFARIMKVIKSATCVGHVSAYYDTVEHSGAAQGGSTESIELAATASGTERAYTCMMILMTSGAASGDVRRICHYNHTTKTATPHAPFSGAVASTDTYEIYRGVVFRNEAGANEDEQTSIRRPFYDAEANETGADKLFNEKVFWKNCHAGGAESTMTNAKIAEVSDPSAKIEFDLESSMNGTDVTAGGGTRLDAPSGYTFDSTQKDCSESGNLDAGDAQGIWMQCDANAGSSPVNTTWVPELTGSLAA